MRLIATFPCRNEDWVVGLSLRVLLMFCDCVIVLVHASTDKTLDIVMQIAHENPDRLVVVGEDKPNWDEMQHRQAMLELARAAGATHVWIGDADEVLTGNLISQNWSGGIRGMISGMRPGSILRLPGYNLRGWITRYHSNGIWGDRHFSTAFTDDPRLRWCGDRFHAREPEGMPLHVEQPLKQADGGVMHLWGASERRLRAKHQLYRQIEALRFPNRSARDINLQYNLWKSPADCAAMYPGQPQWHVPWQYQSTSPEWWRPYAGLLKHLDLNSVPFQEEECRRLVAQYGRERFAGIDLSNVDLPGDLEQSPALAHR